MVQEKYFRQAKDKMLSADSWVIICHENPDGDTLGSALSVCSLGKRLNKKVTVTGRDPLPERYYFLPLSEEYKQYHEGMQLDKNSLYITIDISTEQRGLKEITSSAEETLNIDHHVDNPGFLSLNIIEPEASATAEIVCRLFSYFKDELEPYMTKDEANLLYTALVTDNGNFRFPSTTPESHSCAAVLLEYGASPSEIDYAVNENLTCETMKLWGKIFSRTETFSNGEAAVFWLGQEDIKPEAFDLSAFDGIVNMLLRIKGVKVALYLYETGQGDTVKISIRTKGEFAANSIAAYFGGGGHLRAAGAKFAGTIDACKEKLKTVIEDNADIRNTSGK